MVLFRVYIFMGGRPRVPSPAAANFVGYGPNHLAMERFRALLVKGLNKTAQLLLMEYEKKNDSATIV